MSGIGRYRAVRRLGRGGMAEVLEAVVEGAAGFSRTVAIKRLLPGSGADRRLIEMFLDEAQIASHLHHQNIIAVLDFGVADGHPFQVIEYVDGIDAGRLEGCEPAMPATVALHLCTQVAHALAHAHAATNSEGAPLGIVHRDVKPENIMISWAADVKLGDFGIAFATERTHQTQVGMMKGSYLYMAPEQATRGAIDGRTDVFALGCVLHALVAGESPLSGDALTELLGGEELELSDELPGDIAEIVARSTRRSMHERYQSAEGMAADLGAALAKRIDGDPRSLLRAWLDDVRPAVELIKRPALDDAFILSGSAHGHDPRRSARSSQTDTVASTPNAHREDSAPLVPDRASRRWAAPAIVVVALATLVGVAVVATRDTPPQVAELAELDAAQVVGEPARGLDGSTVATDAGPTLDATTTRAAESKKKKDGENSGRIGKVENRPKKVSSVGSDDKEPPPVVAGDGYLRVGGSGALRAEIRVDGKRRGFAPKLIRLSSGSHDISLVSANGARVATRQVTITVRHTKSRPLSWIVRE